MVKIGDYVWAKQKYLPKWPAQIIATPPGQRQSENKVWVLFFGDRTTGQVEVENITPYDRSDIDASKKSTSGLKAALLDVENDITGYYED